MKHQGHSVVCSDLINYTVYIACGLFGLSVALFNTLIANKQPLCRDGCGCGIFFVHICVCVCVGV